MAARKKPTNGNVHPADEPRLPVPVRRVAAEPKLPRARRGTVHRRTSETDVRVTLDLDGRGVHQIDTRIPFFDHMLQSFAKHALVDLEVLARGDIEVDPHHTVEDVGLCVGRALADALGDKAGIHRYGECARPFDEALVRAYVDFCGRPAFVYKVAMTPGRVGSFDVELAEVFFSALASSAGMNLHLILEYGENRHHVVEGCFKALAGAVRRACELDLRRGADIASTKGSLL